MRFKKTAAVLLLALLLLSCNTAFALNIKADSNAKISLFSQLNNYHTVEVEPVSSRAEGESTVYAYDVSNLAGVTYRVSKDGFITQAGYIDAENPIDIEVVFDKQENAQSCENNVEVINKRLENSVLLGVNSKNFVHLQVGEDYSYAAYRAAWQIVNRDTGNIMIEPDFKHRTVYGGGCVFVKDLGSVGNARDNHVTITGQKEGLAIIETVYEALDISGDSRYTGRYGASDENRSGILVVKVGGESVSLDWGVKWDSERDTLYFVGEGGSLKIKPSVSDDEVDSVSVLNIASGKEFESVLKDGEAYSVPIGNGNNVIRVNLKSGREDYLVVRGKRVTVSIENTAGTRNVKRGDTVNIHIDGLYMPIPKMSAVYNPYRNKIVYTDTSLTEHMSKAHQYDLSASNSLSVAVPSDFEGDVYTLSNGRIYTEMYCAQDITHRDITDSGVDTNVKAVLIKEFYSVLPDIEIILSEDDILSGDVNSDGKVNSRDIAVLQRQVMGSEEKNESGDVNLDGKVNSRDIAFLQKQILGNEV